MKRLFIITPQPFYLDVVTELAHRGLCPTLVCGNRFRSVKEQMADRLSNSVVLSAHDIYAAIVPEQIAAADQTMSADELALIAPHEGKILEMVDRLNYECWPVSELRSVIHRYFVIWRELLRKYQPDAVIFHGTPHMGHDFVLYVLCEHAKIQTLIIEPTYIHERMYMRHNLTGFVGGTAVCCPPRPDSIKEEEKENITTKVQMSHYQKLNQGFNDSVTIKRSLTLINIFRNVVSSLRPRNLFRRVATEPYELSKHYPWTPIHRLRQSRVMLDERRCLRFYERHAESPGAGKFLYYPLHFQPERTTLPDGGSFSDQLLVVRNLAAALPSNWLLYVREHPRQFRRGDLWTKSRSIRYYHALIQIPRVKLIPLDYPSERIITEAAAVSTITGTSAWEAVQNGKPALIWGNPWYGKCPGVFQVKSSEDCAALLGRIDRGELVVSADAVEEYRRKVSSEWGFPGCFLHGFLAASSMNSEQNARHYADAIERGLWGSDMVPGRADCQISATAS